MSEEKNLEEQKTEEQIMVEGKGEESKMEENAMDEKNEKEAVKETSKEGKKEKQKKISKEIVIQYRELEGSLDQIEERIYDQLRQKGQDLSTVEKLQIYVKPQDFTAYYVVNDSIYGKVAIF